MPIRRNGNGGIFYYNPKDKRLFPPKRIAAVGWTTNFASRRSVWAMIGLIPIPIIELLIFLLAEK